MAKSDHRFDLIDSAFEDFRIVYQALRGADGVCDIYECVFDNCYYTGNYVKSLRMVRLKSVQKLTDTELLIVKLSERPILQFDSRVKIGNRWFRLFDMYTGNFDRFTVRAIS